MVKFPKSLFLLFTLFLLVNSAYSQSLVEEATAPLETENRAGSFIETIKIISASKKIFVITNNNQLLGFGDFVSIGLEDKLAARALVAKNHQGNTALKIIKIYSLSQWSKLRKNLEVQIIRGDDSQFEKKTEETKEEVVKSDEKEPSIKSEEDLYNDNLLTSDDGIDLNDDTKRHIKPDNVVGGMAGFFNAKNIEDDNVRGNVMAVSWAYQFTDNYFIEGYYGYTLLKNFPSGAANLSTGVSKMVARLKYNIKAPLYSFIMPYVGFSTQTANSPSAGKGSNTTTNEQENEKVKELTKTSPVFGVTLLRRLVPGWFVKADLGTDVMNLGVAIEF